MKLSGANRISQPVPCQRDCTSTICPRSNEPASMIGPIMLAGSLDLGQIVEVQSRWHGTGWLILFAPLSFITYLIAAIAETNRVPFDLPEAETELVAGFHTEYSAMKFALFFLAEYINMFTVSMLATTLFLGGWNVPFAEDIFGRGTFLFGIVSAIGFLVKVIFFLFIYIWLRGTLPRFRFDQLMDFGWKILLPLALLTIFITRSEERRVGKECRSRWSP